MSAIKTKIVAVANTPNTTVISNQKYSDRPSLIKDKFFDYDIYHVSVDGVEMYAVTEILKQYAIINNKQRISLQNYLQLESTKNYVNMLYKKHCSKNNISSFLNNQEENRTDEDAWDSKHLQNNEKDLTNIESTENNIKNTKINHENNFYGLDKPGVMIKFSFDGYGFVNVRETTLMCEKLLTHCLMWLDINFADDIFNFIEKLRHQDNDFLKHNLEIVEIENNELKLMTQKQTQLISDIQSKNNELNSKNKELEVVNTSLDTKVKELGLVNISLSFKNQELEVVNTSLDFKNKALEIVNTNLDTKVKKLENVNTSLDTKNKELEDVNTSLDSKNKELEITVDNLNSKTKELSKINSTLESKNSSLVKINSKLNTKIEELNKINSEINSKINYLHRINSDLNSKVTELTKLNEELESKSNDLISVNKDLENTIAMLKQKQSELELVIADKNEVIENLNQLKTEYEDKCNELKNKNEELELINKRITQAKLELEHLNQDLQIRVSTLEPRQVIDTCKTNWTLYFAKRNLFLKNGRSLYIHVSFGYRNQRDIPKIIKDNIIYCIKNCPNGQVSRQDTVKQAYEQLRQCHAESCNCKENECYKFLYTVEFRLDLFCTKASYNEYKQRIRDSLTVYNEAALAEYLLCLTPKVTILEILENICEDIVESNNWYDSSCQRYY